MCAILARPVRAENEIQAAATATTSIPAYAHQSRDTTGLGGLGAGTPLSTAPTSGPPFGTRTEYNRRQPSSVNRRSTVSSPAGSQVAPRGRSLGWHYTSRCIVLTSLRRAEGLEVGSATRVGG